MSIKQCLVALALLGVSLNSMAESIKLWRHLTYAAQGKEMKVFYDQVKQFNQLNPDIPVSVEAIPQGAYQDALIGAALARQLPCLIAVDAPKVAHFVWAGILQPIHNIKQNKLNAINHSAKTYYQGQLYALGQFDVALVIYSRRSLLKRLDIRLPDPSRPWHKSEFKKVLAKIKSDSQNPYTIDMNFEETGEWYTYAFLPMLKSAGGAILSSTNPISAEGWLNGQASIKWVKWMKAQIDEGLIPATGLPFNAFLSGQAALHYSGSWALLDYQKAIGDDLLVLPSIDFGKGPLIGGGSWQYGITRECANPQAASRFIDYLMEDEQIAQLSDSTGLVPVTYQAALKSQYYHPDSSGYEVYQMSAKYSVLRPKTPNYPMVSRVFGKALRDIFNGAQVEFALDRAVDKIEQNLQEQSVH